MVDTHQVVDGNPSNWVSTAHGGNKHVVITSKGVLYAAVHHSGTAGITLYGSTDNGATWVYHGAIAGGSIIGGGVFSVYLDEYDIFHMVYAKWAGASGDGRSDKSQIMYRYGMLNASHSGFAAWSGELGLSSVDYWNTPDLIAHRHSDGHIRVHVAFSYSWSGNARHIICYTRVKFDFNTGGIGVEHQSYTVDTVNSQTYYGKPSIEFRHNGNGKTVQQINGLADPTIFISFTHNAQIWYAQYNWTGGNNWGLYTAMAVNGTANIPSDPSAGATHGGVYEHHRWIKTLYDPRDKRFIIIGWVAVAGFSWQGLQLFEFLTTSTSPQVATSLEGNWAANPRTNGILSGTATLDVDGNLHLLGNNAYVDPWYWYAARARILRPKGSNVRTLTDFENIHAGLSSRGARAFTLQYPQGEHHDFYPYSNEVLYHWGNNRGCDYIHTGGSLVRRPTYLKRADGYWVPIAKQRNYTPL